ncbi:unnamed protein product [Kuraishia capsulata CBS 1993]|uniref:GrpE protein homolog n=1 Tax=Kuraishia capsulata CBS 1993 TaxID=1382522 RepID=W6MIX4_9ASCO|nr:uncharacterized protein KUCA_T00001869001 [Kuraishia capsulata CBS 1993]CDK25898.1 unnamed protein product [Kuraishia capsulata CBS 1993]
MQRSLMNMSRLAVRPSSLPLYRAGAFTSVRQLPYRGFATSRGAFAEAAKEGKEESSEEPAATEETDPVAEVTAKLEKKDKELSEMKDRYLRSVADFRNLQETTKREIQKAKDYALQKFAKDLIESVDNFGHALNAVKPETLETNPEVANLYEGVKMTRDIFEKTLSKYGLEKIEPVGEQFDPNRHEATFEVPQPDKEPGTVFHVQQPGFALNGRVLRAAKVGIVKGSE